MRHGLHSPMTIGRALLLGAALMGCKVQERCKGPYCECESDADCAIVNCYTWPVDSLEACQSACCTSGHPVSVAGYQRHQTEGLQPYCSGDLECEDDCASVSCGPGVSFTAACDRGRCVAYSK